MKVGFGGRTCRCLRPEKKKPRSWLRLLLSKLFSSKKNISEPQLDMSRKIVKPLGPQSRSHTSSDGLQAPSLSEPPVDPTPRLWNIPPEILLLIVSRLDLVSAACLRNTNAYFHASINDESEMFTNCVKALMIARLETDMMNNLPKKVICMLCKVKLSQECFRPTTLKHIIISHGVVYLRLMDCKPEERYCANHVVDTIGDYPVSGHEGDEYLSKESPRRWVRRRQLTCLHCGSEIRRDDNMGSADRWKTGCDRCACDICPRAYLPRYERFGPWPRSGMYPMAPKIHSFATRSYEATKIFVYENTCKHIPVIRLQEIG